MFCPLRDPFPYAGGQPKRSVSLTALEIHKRAGNPDYARQSCFMPAPGPGMNPASPARLREKCEAMALLPASFRVFCRVWPLALAFTLRALSDTQK